MTRLTCLAGLFLIALVGPVRAEDLDAWYLIKVEDKAVGYMHLQRKELPDEKAVQFDLVFTQKKGDRLGRERYRQWCLPDRRLTPTRILIGEIGSTEPPRLDVRRDGNTLRGFKAGEKASLNVPAALVAEPTLIEVIRNLPQDAGGVYEFSMLQTLAFAVDGFHKVTHSATEDITVGGRRVGVSRFEHVKSQEKIGVYYVTADRRVVLAKLRGGKIEIGLCTEKEAKAAFGE